MPSRAAWSASGETGSVCVFSNTDANAWLMKLRSSVNFDVAGARCKIGSLV